MGLLRSHRQCIPRQRRLILEGLVRYAARFRHVLRPRAKRLRPKFYYWDYSPRRKGAFYDIDAGLNPRERPKASILVRTTGKRRFLSMALATVANQTYPNVEVVVVEDGKPTVQDLLDRFDSLDITYEALGKNMERSVAGNRAMQLASGEYLIFLDDDDLLYADHIEQLVAALVTNRAKMAFSYAFEIPTRLGPDGRFIAEEGDFISRHLRPFSFSYLLFQNFMPINTVMFHRSLFEACGGFDEDLVTLEDWDLWIRCSLQAKKVVHVPKTTALYRFPMYAREQEEKNRERWQSLEIVLKKQANLPIDLTVGEFRDLI